LTSIEEVNDSPSRFRASSEIQSQSQVNASQDHDAQGCLIQEHMDASVFKLDIGTPKALVSFDWLKMRLSMADILEGNNALFTPTHTWTRGIIRLEPYSPAAHLNTQVIHHDNIVSGKGLLLQSHLDDNDKQLCFVLQRTDHQSIHFRCQWEQ
jgi:hypothetical protein